MRSTPTAVLALCATLAGIAGAHRGHRRRRPLLDFQFGFYAKGLDGRIDDPNAGWKGRGVWSTSGDRTPWLMEGGKGSKPRAVQIQFRPNPLAN